MCFQFLFWLWVRMHSKVYTRIYSMWSIVWCLLCELRLFNISAGNVRPGSQIWLFNILYLALGMPHWLCCVSSLSACAVLCIWIVAMCLSCLHDVTCLEIVCMVWCVWKLLFFNFFIIKFYGVQKRKNIQVTNYKKIKKSTCVWKLFVLGVWP